MLADNIKSSDIVVLSRNRLENAGVANCDGGTDFKLVEGSAADRSRIRPIRFATIQAFKGMESPVIILCDVAQVTEREPQSLLYVAMSRARSHLTVLVDQRVKPMIRECLLRKLEVLKKS